MQIVSVRYRSMQIVTLIFMLLENHYRSTPIDANRYIDFHAFGISLQFIPDRCKSFHWPSRAFLVVTDRCRLTHFVTLIATGISSFIRSLQIITNRCGSFHGAWPSRNPALRSRNGCQIRIISPKPNFNASLWKKVSTIQFGVCEQGRARISSTEN